MDESTDNDSSVSNGRGFIAASGTLFNDVLYNAAHSLAKPTRLKQSPRLGKMAISKMVSFSWAS
jgi:hypothetical protein